MTNWLWLTALVYDGTPKKQNLPLPDIHLGKVVNCPRKKRKEAEDIFARREIIGYLMAHFTTQEA